MHSIFQDVRFGLRMLTKNPGITLVAIFTLGLGIGANTATFSLSNTFLRKPVSFPEVERLVMPERFFLPLWWCSAVTSLHGALRGLIPRVPYAMSDPEEHMIWNR
jgi:hypothetical protein